MAGGHVWTVVPFASAKLYCDISTKVWTALTGPEIEVSDCCSMILFAPSNW